MPRGQEQTAGRLGRCAGAKQAGLGLSLPRPHRSRRGVHIGAKLGLRRDEHPPLRGWIDMNLYLLMMTFRVWLLELAVTAVNYFFLMNMVYRPRYGKLKAHQIGMGTRIAYICLRVFYLVAGEALYCTRCVQRWSLLAVAHIGIRVDRQLHPEAPRP